MIEFNCEHCGKALHLADHYAGRDGWCRVCKQMVIVPRDGRSPRVRELSKEEGFERLQRLLQYAATKADKFKRHLAQRRDEGSIVAARKEALDGVRELLSEKENALQALRKAAESQRNSMAIERAEMASRIEVLESLVAARPAESEAPEALKDACDEVLALKRRIDEQDLLLMQLREAAHAEPALPKHEAAENTYTETIARQREELAAQKETLAALQKCRNVGDQTTREQIRALEEQVVIVNELKERMNSLQNRVQALDRERLDLTQSAEEAVRMHEIEAQKSADLEARLHDAAEEKSVLLVQLEDLRRDCVCNEEQVKQLSDELQRLADARSASDLDRDRASQATKAAAERVASLVEDLAVSAQTNDEQALACAALLEQLTAAQARQAALESRLEREEDDRAAAHDAQGQVELLTAEREALSRDLAEARGRIQALEARTADDYSLSEEVLDLTDSVIGEDYIDAGEGALRSADLSEPVTEIQRQQERKQMMDVLSDFLDK
ncbi:MAG: hypothetical protein L3K26_11080 [Candidatus Hydrogenedentes bacterium]|nr:hypothetical protein [Candidatus Hydrogenedentota bacterium]